MEERGKEKIVRSPCRRCPRRYLDKQQCCKTCKRLAAYNAGESWEWFEIPKIGGEEMDQAEMDQKSLNEEIAKTEKAIREKYATGPKEKSRQEKVFKTCEVNGCKVKAKARGKCKKHYALWQNGKLPGFPPFEKIEHHKPHKPKKKKAGNVKRCPCPKENGTLTIDLSAYPALREVINDTAKHLFLTPEHVLINLAGQALAAQQERADK